MSSEPSIYPDPEPDRPEVWVRGICGAVLGLFVALCIWLRLGGLSVAASVALFAGAVAVCAWGSAKYGDSFWYAALGRRW